MHFLQGLICSVLNLLNGVILPCRLKSKGSRVLIGGGGGGDVCFLC